MDFRDQKLIGRLKNAIAWSDNQLAHFRRKRMEVLQQYVGHHYGNGGSTDKVPINLIAMGVTTYQRQVSVSEPQAHIATPYQDLQASAAEFKLAVNQKLCRINAETAMNMAGLEALFMLGCVEVGIDGEGEPFIEPVLFDDLVLDMSAKSWGQVGYVGHRFRMPADWVRKNKSYDAAMRAKIAPSDVFSPTGDGASDSETQSQTLTMGGNRKVEEYKDHIELTQLYLPGEKLKIVFANNDPAQTLSATPWKGPEYSHNDATKIGMYHFCSHISVPGNLMPVGMVQLWRDLHDVTNRLANKVFRQAERQKTVLGVHSSAAKDGARVVDTSDGQAIAMDSMDGIKEFSTGGANQQSLGMVTWTKQLFNWQSGNTDSLSGSAPSTDTVGQDTLLASAAGGTVASMRKTMLSFARSVITDLAWWMWTDPISAQSVSRKIPGSDEQITFPWDRSRRKGDFLQYNFEIEPYSAVRRTPQERLQVLDMLNQKFVMPNMQGMLAAGMVPDYEFQLKTAAEYAGVPEFAKWMIFQTGQQNPTSQPGAGATAQPQMPEAKPPGLMGEDGGGRPAAAGGSQGSLGDTETQMLAGMMGAGGPVER